MKTSVTRKKTLKLKRPSPATAEVQRETAQPAGAPQAAVPARLQQSAQPARESNYTVAGVLAILAFLMFATLIALQALELNYYQAPTPRSVWPVHGPR